MRIDAKELRGERKVNLWDAVPLAGPWSLWIDVTNYCNFKCVYCPTGNADMLKAVKRPTGFMSMELIHKIIRDLKQMPKAKIIGFYKDGEPLVHRDFTSIVSAFKHAKVSEQLWVRTNGELIGSHPGLATCGLDFVGISVPHVTEEGIRKTIGKNINYEKYLANIKRLYKSERTFKLYAKICDTGLTELEKEKFYTDFEPICDAVSIEGLHGWTSDMKNLQLINSGTVDGIPFVKKTACPLPFYMVSISFNGHVSACNDDWAYFHQLGDVSKQSLKEIWNGEKFQSFRLMHLEGRRAENRACRGCQYIESLPDNIDEHLEEMRRKIYGS